MAGNYEMVGMAHFTCVWNVWVADKAVFITCHSRSPHRWMSQIKCCTNLQALLCVFAF